MLENEIPSASSAATNAAVTQAEIATAPVASASVHGGTLSARDRRTIFSRELLVGAGLTLLGFAFAIGWDCWKTARQERVDRITALVVLDRAAVWVTSAANENIRTLRADIACLESDKQMAAPPYRMSESDAWARVVSSGKIPLEELGQLNQVNHAFMIAGVCNDYLMAREAYRMNSRHVPQYRAELKAFDAVLIEQLELAVREMVKADATLKEHLQHGTAPPAASGTPPGDLHAPGLPAAKLPTLAKEDLAEGLRRVVEVERIQPCPCGSGARVIDAISPQLPDGLFEIVQVGCPKCNQVLWRNPNWPIPGTKAK